MYLPDVRVRLHACVVFLAAVIGCRGPEVPALPPGFSEQIVLSGLVSPTAVRFARDGRVFVAEKGGVIKEFARLGATTARVVADLSPEVYNFKDRGLLDIALDPRFPDEPYLYALYTLDGYIGDSLEAGTVPRYQDDCRAPKTVGCLAAGRLARLTLEPTLEATNRSQTVLIENWGQQFPSHSVGSLEFGPDGRLYVSAGDGASYGRVDYGQFGGEDLGDRPDPIDFPTDPPAARGGALRAQVVEPPSPVDPFPTWFNGKVIRFDLDGPATAVVASGLRNPFRMAFRPGTPELWIGDVGWNMWEELNRVTDATGDQIDNFGWPCFEGEEAQPDYQAAGLDLCARLYRRPDRHQRPLFSYQHKQPVMKDDACGRGGSSIAGVAFYEGGNYPAQYRGALFFADYGRGCIWAMLPDGSHQPRPERRQNFRVGASRPVQLRVGPGGDLFYVDLGGTVRRIVFGGTGGVDHRPTPKRIGHAPVPIIDQPGAGAWAVEDEVHFAGHATDQEDGPLPPEALRWSVVLMHCPDGCHEHPLRDLVGVAEGSAGIPDHESPTYVELRLTATDSHGNSATTGLRLDPTTPAGSR